MNVSVENFNTAARITFTVDSCGSPFVQWVDTNAGRQIVAAKLIHAAVKLLGSEKDFLDFITRKEAEEY